MGTVCKILYDVWSESTDFFYSSEGLLNQAIINLI